MYVYTLDSNKGMEKWLGGSSVGVTSCLDVHREEMERSLRCSSCNELKVDFQSSLGQAKTWKAERRGHQPQRKDCHVFGKLINRTIYKPLGKEGPS